MYSKLLIACSSIKAIQTYSYLSLQKLYIFVCDNILSILCRESMLDSQSSSLVLGMGFQQMKSAVALKLSSCEIVPLNLSN